MTNNIKIKNKIKIGNELEPYFIAEIGTNHNRDINLAKKLIEAAKIADFDCVKFQTYEPEEIVNPNVNAKDYNLNKFYGEISAHKMFDKFLKTPKNWFPELTDFCKDLEIDCATTIHGDNGINWVKNMDFDWIKIASMDHNNLPFLTTVLEEIELPILISIGMGYETEIDKIVKLLRDHKYGLGIFHCVSIYPPEFEDLRFGNIRYLLNKYNLPIGFSDHTIDTYSANFALTQGARFFEKHITLDKNMIGPDHSFAIEPNEMKIYTKNINTLYRDIFTKEFQKLSKKEEN